MRVQPDPVATKGRKKDKAEQQQNRQKLLFAKSDVAKAAVNGYVKGKTVKQVSWSISA